MLREDGYIDYFWLISGLWQPAKPNGHAALLQTAGGWLYTMPDGAQEQFDAQGRLTRETDATGKITTIAYSSNQMLVTGPYGHVLAITLDAAGRVTALTDPAGNTTNYAWDANNNLVSVVYSDGTGRLHHYENPNFQRHLTGVSLTAANGAVSRYSHFDYDAQGRAILTEHAQTDNGAPQERFALRYDSDTQTTVTDPAGNIEVYTFTTGNGLKLLRQHTFPDNKYTYKWYDAKNNLTQESDENGITRNFAYNATNQRVSMMEGSGTRTTTYQYVSTDADLPTVIESPSVYSGATKRTEIGYDAARRPTVITQRGFTPSGQAISRSISLSYNSAGQVTQVDGPRTDANDVTTLAYYDCIAGNACGQLRQLTNALGQVTTFDAYDPSGRLLSYADPNGLRTDLVYDLLGRVQSQTQRAPTGEVRTTQYQYDAFGNLVQANFPDGRVLAYGYDASQKLRRVTDSLGNRIDYGYDVKGNRTAEKTYDPDGTLVRTVDYTFNNRNFLTAANRAGSLTQYLRDFVGNLTKETDPNNNADSPIYNYDALYRIRWILQQGTGYTTFAYDINDRLTRVQTPASLITQYAYDDLGNLLKEISPDRGTTTYTYDAAGNVTSQTDARGVTVNYAYDALNRVATVDYPGGSEDIAYTYDSSTNCIAGIGRLCQVTDASGGTEYAYDAFGNVITDIHTELSIIYTTRYTYDAADRIASITYPDGRVATYARDLLGRVQNVSATVNNAQSALITGRTYRADGLVLTQSFGNGLNEVRQYDLQGRLTTQFVGSADTRRYGYDANGNLTSLQGLAQVSSYLYDSRNRLTKDTRGSAITNFGYIGDDNRYWINENAPGMYYTYQNVYATNRLTKVGTTTTLTLDAAGNTLTYGNYGYSYNNAGQLSQVLNSGVLAGSYSYNAQHQRTRKIVGSQATVYHYDLAGNLILETNVDGQPQVAYVYADNIPIGHILRSGTNETLSYIHTDHEGTPRLATNTAQSVVWRWEGRAFGDTAPTGSVTVNLRFAGQYFDGESGLYYNWNRYYDPKIGRYITADTRGINQHVQPMLVRMRATAMLSSIGISITPSFTEPPLELNPYAYTANNPLHWVDPKGEGAVVAGFIIGGTCFALGCTGYAYLVCANAFPSYADLLSPDRPKFFQCIPQRVKFCATFGAYLMDPIGSAASTVGEKAGGGPVE